MIKDRDDNSLILKKKKKEKKYKKYVVYVLCFHQVRD